jgi:hypothetical protein
VPIVKQELLVLLEHQISFLVFSGDRVVQSSVFCVVFVLLEHQISFHSTINILYKKSIIIVAKLLYWNSGNYRRMKIITTIIIALIVYRTLKV